MPGYFNVGGFTDGIAIPSSQLDAVGGAIAVTISADSDLGDLIRDAVQDGAMQGSMEGTQTGIENGQEQQRDQEILTNRTNF